jgi:uncharacterized membrane protein (UPF0127 family)
MLVYPANFSEAGCSPILPWNIKYMIIPGKQGLIILLFCLFCGIFCGTARSSDGLKETMRTVIVATEKGALKAHIADTEPLRLRGLLGRKVLDNDRAMLLDFIRPGHYSIHMEGMAFPIDAVWLDQRGAIVKVYHGIKPNSGIVYPSIKEARYCLETPAGAARRLGMVRGGFVKFLPH